MRFFLALILLVLPLFAPAKATNKEHTDWLLKKLSSSAEDTNRVLILYDLANQYLNTNPTTGLKYGNQCLALAQKLNWRKGIAMGKNISGLNYRFLTQFDKAEENLKEALPVFIELKETIRIYECCRNLRSVYQSQGNNPKAIEFILTMLPMYAEDINKIDILDDLSYDYTTVNPELGIKYGLQELELAKKLNNNKAIANAYNQIGLNYRFRSDYPNALEFHKKALSLFEDIRDTINIGQAKSNIGIVYQAMGNFPKALECFYGSLRINELKNDPNNMAGDYGNIGTVYQSQSNYPKALEYYFKSLKLFEKLGDKVGQANNYGNIAIIYHSQNNFDKSLEFNFKALRLFEEIGDMAGTANTRLNIGSDYSAVSKYAQSLRYLFSALKISQEQGDAGGVALVTGNIGVDYYAIAIDSINKIPADSLIPVDRKVSMAKAIIYLDKATAECLRLNMPGNYIDFGMSLTDAYKRTGNYAKALETFTIYTTINDSIYSNNSKVQIANLGAEREMELKDKQLLIDKLEIVKNRNRNALFLVSIVLLLIVVGVIAKVSNNRKKSNELLTDEKRLHILQINKQKEVIVDIANIQAQDVTAHVKQLLDIVGSFNLENIEDPDNGLIVEQVAQQNEKLDAIVKSLVFKENALKNSSWDNSII